MTFALGAPSLLPPQPQLKHPGNDHLKMAAAPNLDQNTHQEENGLINKTGRLLTANHSEVILIDDPQDIGSAENVQLAQSQKEAKKTAVRPPTDDRVCSVVEGIIAPQLKTLTNKVIAPASTMIQQNKLVPSRENALKAWTGRPADDPYIPKSANIKTTLTSSNAIHGDPKATELQAHFEVIKSEPQRLS
jgi:hypothetical protein